MTNRVQTLRSSVPGNRPATGTRAVGELYVCYPDLQLGVINAAQAAQDLLAVRNFSSTASYVAGDIIVNGGQIYTALGPIAPGAFNPAQWQSVSAASVIVGDVAPTTPAQGDLWYDSLGGQMYVWYDDGTSQQWVIVVNNAQDLSPYALTSSVAGVYLPLAGGTMTGPVNGTSATFTQASIVPAAGSASIFLSTSAGNADQIVGGRASGGRWSVVLGDTSPESGANAGSNFEIGRYSDAGAIIDSPFALNRASGLATFAHDVSMVAGPANQQFTMNCNGGFARSMAWQSQGNNRWMLQIDGATESGGNVGSDLHLYNFSDAGGLLSNVIQANRASGVVTFGQPIVNPSARALKQDITPIDSTLAIIEKLQGMFYKYKGADKRHVGLIAEDVQPVLPEVVFDSGQEDGLGISYPQIVSVLIEALKELSAEVKALKQGAR